ncbi:MAG: hypothetical protein J2P23_06985, partial [Microlunatus sp.]|nr:hypothetical protein [Microlunatus sp.]
PDDATITPIHEPGIDVSKSAEPTTYGVAGEDVVYTFRVTNTGNVTLTNINLTDSVMGDINCPETTLEPGDHMICNATYTTTQADVNNGSVFNRATVTGDPPTGPPVTDTDDETITAIHEPAITVVKSADPGTFSAAGQEITYTFRVTNSGNVTLTNINLNDSVLGSIDCPHTTLDPGDHMTCTAMYTITQADVDHGSVFNSVTATGDPPTGPPVRDVDNETITAEHAPGITVDKTADPGTFSGAGDTITYTYKVTNTGNVTLTNVDLTDSVLGSISCPHTTLDPGAHMTCTADYTTTQADVTNGSIFNRATVTGDPPTGPPVRDTDDVTVTLRTQPTTPPTSPPPTSPPATQPPPATTPPVGPQPPAPPVPPLAGTGLPGNVFDLLFLAATLLIAGGIFTIAARRRRKRGEGAR